MTPAQFRRLALRLPETTASAHMDHPDFRVKGKIFATLSVRGDEAMGMVKLDADEQAALVAGAPHVFQPASGAWGRQGCTMVRLAAADTEVVRSALVSAWRRTAPKRLTAEFEGE